MNTEGLRWIAAASAGLGCLAVVPLLWRLAATLRSVEGGQSDLPWLLRVSFAPSGLISPYIQPLLPVSWSRHARQLLAAEVWGASVSPALWYAIRLIHGAVAAGLSGILCCLGSWPIALGMVMGGCGGFLLGAVWLGRQRERMLRSVSRDLPRFLDLLTVCVEAGATLTSGIRLIVARAPSGSLRFYFERVLREIRGGRSRSQAFESVARDFGAPELEALAMALVHAESAGMSLGGVLRSQAGQWTAARFARAEKLAMQAPVKLLGPLILCIFPCTFVVLAVPVVMRLAEAFR